MKQQRKLHHTIAMAGLIASALITAQSLANPTLNATSAKPKFQVQVAGAIPKPAACAQGFTPVSKKLIKHEGKAWYEYTCARSETIVRTCNPDTDVTNIKNDIVSLPSDGTSHNSKLNLSYKCFRYVPVE
ncbi:hypothetical protein L1F30_05210 [Simiduia sp. 21SJ11W-1]|uniref:hypothetical protein n=1 Tax=Simiduia sp. 21SJ11W-1 TaxID=2909669 RepID=UPI0020A1DBBC|nr:hypothetical protein [Simiduia sp. 21SJ11W-1]UTA48945.1 hypothetical protein L1F30_05210 [Simiduia sp. 21SJ11W-1]